MVNGMTDKQPIQETWQRYLQHRRKRDRNELVRQYAPLVDQHSARMAKKLPVHISFDEIRCAAFDGLLQAIETFDPTCGASFQTFCRQRLFGAVVDWLRTVDTQGRALRTFEKKRNHISTQLRAECGHSPAPQEIASRMDMGVSKFNRLCRVSAAGQPIAFSTLESANESPGGAPRALTIHDRKAEDPSREISRSMLAAHLSRGLSRNEKAILVLYYYENLTMSEIGAALSLSESRVSQIHRDILDRLRRNGGTQLREELAG